VTNGAARVSDIDPHRRRSLNVILSDRKPELNKVHLSWKGGKMPGVYKLMAGYHNGGGNFFANIWSFQLSEAGTGHPWDYANALITKFAATNEAPLLDCLGNDVVLDFYQCKKVNGGGGPSATQGRGSFGTGSAVSVTSQLAADISWIVTSANNRFGHSYLGAIPEGALEGDVFQVGYLVTVAAFVNAMVTQLTLAGALGTAVFGVYTKKTDTFNSCDKGLIKPKATVMNKRALPRV
jgi:hypothetical protein